MQNLAKMTAFILCLSAVIIVALLVGKSNREANARTLVYSRFVGVWLVIPETPYDDSVEARADALREAFAAHGNPYAEVVAYPYGLPIGKEASAGTDWQQFLSMVAGDYLQRVQEYTAKRTAKDNKAAAEFIAGQILNQQFTKN